MKYVVLFALVVGCGGGSGDPGSPDAAAGPPDAAGPRCDPTSPFGTPVAVDGLATTLDESSAQFSPDERTAYFSMGATSGSPQIYVAHRASRTAPFDTPQPMPGMTGDVSPSVSADGLTIVFTFFQPGQTVHLQLATRASVQDDFGAPVDVLGYDTENAPIGPYLTADGDGLYFTLIQQVDGYSIWRASRVGATYDNPIKITAVSTTGNDGDPVVSADELSLYYSGPAGLGEATRASLDDEFSAPVVHGELSGYTPSWVSRDECRLYLTGGSYGAEDVYVASRPLPQ